MNIVQFVTADGQRRVAVVKAGVGHVVAGASSTYALVCAALGAGHTLAEEVARAGVSGEVKLAALEGEGRLLSPIDHPDPSHLLVTGTGLTHLGSANARDAMHQAAAAHAVTDSMRMFQLGINGGKPGPGQKGVQPEWFYKGNGHTLVAPGATLRSPSFALDGGEEPEIAGIYIIGPNGQPVRIGFCLANEFSDHVTEKQNYLYLAHSKLRQSAIGPELLVGDLPQHIEGTSRIIRNGQVIWEKPFLSGEQNMSHSIANLEYHHFKYEVFRNPGDLHVHMFGTATLSVSDGISTENGDCFEIAANPFGQILRNRLETAPEDKLSIGALY